MTEKQQKIIIAALRLFAELGYDSTSTSRIAKEAGVSEGLIFRHYKNKEGLLEAVVASGLELANGYFQTIIAIENPKHRIKAAISLPFLIEESEHQFWKLIYALKWQRGVSDRAGLDALLDSLSNAFDELGYKNPRAESKLIEVIIDGVASEVLLKQQDASDILQILLNKYDLN